MCLWLSISLSTFLLFFFLWVAAVFQTVFSVFFYAATITAAAAVFLYLFIKRLCVCVSAFIICCVFACVRAVHSFYFVVLCLFLFFRLLKNSLIYSQLKRKKNQQLYYLSFLCACVLIPTRLLCVCVWFLFFSVDYRWVYGCLYFIYLFVYVCYVCDYHRHWKKNKEKQTIKENFCFVVKYGKKTTEVDFSFSWQRDYLTVSVCMCVFFSVYLYVLLSVLKNNIH